MRVLCFRSALSQRGRVHTDEAESCSSPHTCVQRRGEKNVAASFGRTVRQLNYRRTNLDRIYDPVGNVTARISMEAVVSQDP